MKTFSWLFVLALLSAASAIADERYRTLDFRCLTRFGLETYAGEQKIAVGKTYFSVVTNVTNRDFSGDGDYFLKPIKMSLANSKMQKWVTRFKVRTRVHNICTYATCKHQQYLFKFRLAKDDLRGILRDIGWPRAEEVESGTTLGLYVSTLLQTPVLEDGYDAENIVELKNQPAGDRLHVRMHCYYPSREYGSNYGAGYDSFPEL